jgi:tungstate transport system ATP-binding protein
LGIILLSISLLINSTLHSIQRKGGGSRQTGAARVPHRKTYTGRGAEGLSFSFDQPGIYVLTGANGCGKSTFLRICSLLEPPDNGEIIYFDERGAVPCDIALQRRITLVLPKIGLFNTTVFKNISYGLRIRGMKGKKLRPVWKSS